MTTTQTHPAAVLGRWSFAVLLAAAVWAPAAAAEVAGSAEEVRPPLLGSSAPEVELRSLEGDAVDLAKTVAEKPTVLIFYRGGW